MELTESYLLPVDRQTAWNALIDPQVLKTCIDGCESFERTGDTTFTCVVMARVGPVKARFTSKVTLSGIDAPYGYTLTFDGHGGPAGFSRGSARVNLSEESGRTRLTYTAYAHVGGKLTLVGSGMIDDTARKMASDFFARFAERLGGSREPPAGVEAPVAAGWGRRHRYFPLLLLVVAVIGLVTLLYIFMHR